ncbi:MAG: hypothetical protein AB1817_04530 [Chloroflexota bacterium]
MTRLERMWRTVEFIGVVIGLVVNAATILGWSQGNLHLPSYTLMLPVFNIPVSSSGGSLAVLVLIFVVLVAISTTSYRIALFAGLVIPLFFVWAGIFRQLDDLWVVLGLFFWADVYGGIYLLAKDIPRNIRWWSPAISKILSRDLRSKISCIVTPGFFLFPVAMFWLQEVYGFQWYSAIGLGLLIGHGGWLAVFGITLIGICIAAVFFQLKNRLDRRRSQID